jgi:hypothetical protein
VNLVLNGFRKSKNHLVDVHYGPLGFEAMIKYLIIMPKGCCMPYYIASIFL